MAQNTLSIMDTHKEILKIIPDNQKVLIYDLNVFINKLQQEKRPQKYYIEKHVYVCYLHVLLKHLPKRPLLNSDPNWMWESQEVFSKSYNV
jgi:hypothetical protein